MKYRRMRVQGGVYFFTVVTHERQPVFGQLEPVRALKYAFKNIMVKLPFKMDAIVVLPDHLHCIWSLPENDSDFSTRWRLIKTGVTKSLSFSAGQFVRIWQNRYWEHLIKDEDDYRNHFDYIHYNPVKHGLVAAPNEWEHSSFRKHVDKGVYSDGWGSSEIIIPNHIGLE